MAGAIQEPGWITWVRPLIFEFRKKKQKPKKSVLGAIFWKGVVGREQKPHRSGIGVSMDHARCYDSAQLSHFQWHLNLLG
jgi:hypothetical protein